MIRLIDFVAALLGIIILLPFLLFISLVLFLDHGRPFFIQKRVGKNMTEFNLVKFRTMSPNAANLPTHEISKEFITRTGRFLRASKLDELPQLWNVLVGEMSLVGPRPCLPTQDVLILERRALGVLKLRPGITGPAQVKNIDMSKPKILALEDSVLVEKLTIFSYFKYVIMTLTGSGLGDKLSA